MTSPAHPLAAPQSSPSRFARRLRQTLVAATLGATAWAAQGAGATGLDLAQARDALAAGAVAWDLRDRGALPPGAVRLPAPAVQAWLAQGDVAALAAAVSAAGLNLSASVLVVADDAAQAQAVAERLSPLARGRVQWLAAGMPAWVAAGLPTVATPERRLPMPQRLVADRADGSAAAQAALQPADALRRTSTAFSLAPPAAQQVAQGS